MGGTDVLLGDEAIARKPKVHAPHIMVSIHASVKLRKGTVGGDREPPAHSPAVCRCLTPLTLESRMQTKEIHMSDFLFFLVGIGAQELIIILVILLILFGGTRLPSLAKGLGESVRNFKQGISEDPEDVKKREEKTRAV
jgi:sec-independent protein translocase protein TatA